MSNFPSTAFQSSLSVEAILFAVFGFFYSAYALYLSQPNKVAPPYIAVGLRRGCQVITLLIVLNTLLSIWSLAHINFSSPADMITARLCVLMVAIAIISGIWTFRYM
jgi:hypothetical protein